MNAYKKRVAKGFSILAPIYDHLAELIFGNAILESQTSFISRIASQSTILILGGGTGRILRKLDDLGVPLKIDYVEISQGMINRAKKNNLINLEIRFLTEKPSNCEQYDVVFAAFYFDVLTNNELIQEIREIRYLIAPDGMVILTDFQVTGNAFSRVWQKSITTIMYLFFRLVTGMNTMKLHNFQIFLASENFKTVDEKLFFGGFIASRVFSLNPLIKS